MVAGLLNGRPMAWAFRPNFNDTLLAHRCRIQIDSRRRTVVRTYPYPSIIRLTHLSYWLAYEPEVDL